MRTFTIWSAALVAALLIPLNADAHPRAARTQIPRPLTYEYGRDFARQRAADELMDRIRANDLDPANNYRGYPDWARKAFAPKN
jgi:hypothetical protein